MPGDPKQCREYALHCAEMAQRARNLEHKRTLTDLAQTWLNLAIELERTHALVDDFPQPIPSRPGPRAPAKPH